MSASPEKAASQTSAAQAPSAPPRDGGRLPAGDKLTIGALLVSTFVMILNETLMNVALQPLMEEFQVTEPTIQWLTTAFMLTLAIVIPITGFLMQRYSLRAVFTAAMALFILGTALAAAAPGFEVLLAGRVVQASGTAIMLPLMMTTVLTLVPLHRRGVVMGNISIVISVAPATGPALSGLILHIAEWRWLFLMILPIAVIALVLGRPRLNNDRAPGARACRSPRCCWQSPASAAWSTGSARSAAVTAPRRSPPTPPRAWTRWPSRCSSSVSCV